MKRFWFQEDGQVFILDESQILQFNRPASPAEATNNNLALKMLCLGGFLFYIKAAEWQNGIKINTCMCMTNDGVIASQDKTKLIISQFSDQTCVLCCSVIKNSRRNPANK